MKIDWLAANRRYLTVGLLLFLAMSLRGCGSPSGTEIVVKLIEGDRRLTTESVGGQSALLYGGQPFDLFDGLPGADHLEIRQSLPVFGRRWAPEREWRTGRRDSLGIEALETVLAACGEPVGVDTSAVWGLIRTWKGDRAVIQADPGGLQALAKLVAGGPISEADSTAIESFLGELQADGDVIGRSDPLALPAIGGLTLKCGAIATSDSLALLSFARRLREGGGVSGIDAIAIPGILRVLRDGGSMTVRESYAASSLVSLLANEAAPGRSVSRGSVDLFLRVRTTRRLHLGGLLDSIRAIAEVEFAHIAFPDAETAPSCTAEVLEGGMAAAQGYQKSADNGGIDAEFVWSVADGGAFTMSDDEVGVGVTLCDRGFWPGHASLPEIRLLKPDHVPDSEPADDVEHGTRALGVLAARDDAVGLLGVAYRLERFMFSTTSTASSLDDTAVGVLAALDRAAGDSQFLDGDVIVIEGQSLATVDVGSGCCPGTISELVPVEVNADVFELIRTAVEDYGGEVVEAAANGSWGLVDVIQDGETIWKPTDDSGAIIVGAGRAFVEGSSDSHTRKNTSNYGDRVDCQGWGEEVCTISFSFEDPVEFNDTSAATAVVGGVVAVMRSAVKSHDVFITPGLLRGCLRESEFGTPQPEADAGEGRIGPLPDLRRLYEDLILSESDHQ